MPSSIAGPILYAFSIAATGSGLSELFPASRDMTEAIAYICESLAVSFFQRIRYVARFVRADNRLFFN